MTKETALDWRGPWPWGRISPSKRLADLVRRKADTVERRKRLEDAFKERLVDFDRALEAIEQDMVIAQKCEGDRCRRQVQAITEVLKKKRIAIPAELLARTPDQALIEELELLSHDVAGIEDDADQGADAGGPVEFEEMAGIARGRAQKGKS